MTMIDEYYNKQGEKIGRDEFCELFSNEEYRIINQDLVGLYLISTVWLGLNHPLWSSEEPVIFETIVFDSEGNSVESERYTSERSAINGHNKFVQDYKRAINLINKGHMKKRPIVRLCRTGSMNGRV